MRERWSLCCSGKSKKWAVTMSFVKTQRKRERGRERERESERGKERRRGRGREKLKKDRSNDF